MEISISSLRRIPIFSEITREKILAFASILKEEKFSEGESIVREGDSGDSMYIIESGVVEVRKVIERDSGRYKTLAILESGDFFGEMSIFGSEPRSADVVAVQDTVLWKLAYDSLHSLTKDDPDSTNRILEIMISIFVMRVKALNNELATLYELGRIMPEVKSVESLAREALKLVMHSVPSADKGIFAVWNVFNEEFDVQQSVPASRGKVVSCNDPVAALIMQDMKPVIVKDTGIDERYTPVLCSGASFIATPVLYEKDLLGFIMLSNSSAKNAFNYNHQILLSAVSSQLGTRINDLERQKEDLLKLRLERSRLL